MKKITAVMVSVFLFNSCSREHLFDCTKSTGEMVTITRTLDPFTSLNVGEQFEIELIYDTLNQESITITGGKNLVSGYNTKVVNSKLDLSNQNKCNFVRTFKQKPKAVIRLKNLLVLDIKGSARVTCLNTLVTPELNIIHNGLEDAHINIQAGFIRCNSFNTGGFVFKGFSNIFACGLEDIGGLDASNLLTDDTYLFQYSTSDARVNADKVLKIELFGSGNVYYQNNPQVFETKITGIGKVIKE